MLTDEEIRAIAKEMPEFDLLAFARKIEQAVMLKARQMFVD